MSFDHTIKAGTTDKTIEVMMRDSTTGQGLTGLTSSSVTCYYMREGNNASTSVTLSNGTLGLYLSGSWVAVTNIDGLYQFNIPDAALASGVDAVTLSFTATGAIDKTIRICLLSVDLRDATDLGLTNLDAAVSTRSSHSAADAADSVWDELQSAHTTVGSFGYYLDAQVSAAGGGSLTASQIADAVWTEALSDHSSTVGSTAEALGGASAPTAAQVADAVWTEALSDHSGTAGSTAEALDGAVAPTVSQIADAVWDEAQSGHTTSGTFGYYLDAIVSDNVAPTEAEIYTYFTDGTRPDSFKTDVSGLATSASITALNDITASDVYTYFTSLSRQDTFKADVATVESLVTTVDTVVDSIKTKTDQLTFTVTGQVDSNVLSGGGALAAETYTYFTTAGREDSFKADVSALATSASISALNDPSEADIYTYFTAVNREDVFKADISGLNDISAADVYTYFTAGANEDVFKADVSSLATSAALFNLQTSVNNLNDPSAADVYSYFTSGANEDAFKADVSGLSTSSEIAALNDLTAAQIYSYFTTGTNADVFKANLSGVSTFDPATDAVANVTTVASVTNPVNTTVSSQNASKADVSALATSASISALNDVSAADVYAYFTAGTNENAFKADLSVLNDITAADVYTYFTSLSREDVFKADTSALASQASVDIVDANVDAVKAKTDNLTFSVAGQVDANAVTGSAPTEAEVYTYFTSAGREDLFKANVAPLATQASLNTVKAKTDQLAFTVGGQVDANALTTAAPTAGEVYTYFTSGTNENVFKADTTGLATSAQIAALNDFDPATQSVVVGVNNDKTGYALSEASRQAIGDDFLSHELTKGDPNTIERAFWQSIKATAAITGEVTGSATTSAFNTDLTNTTGAFDDLLVVFVSGALEGEARPIDSYSSVNGRIVLQEPLTTIPQGGDEFLIINSHSASAEDIAAAVWDASQSSHTVAGTFGEYLDARVSDATALTPSEVASAVWDADSGSYTLTDSFGYNLDSRVSLAGAAGAGLYRVTVLVQDDSLAAIPNARVNVEGTTLTLTTNSLGICEFNLDSGVYTLACAPPDGYDTPLDNVITVVSSDVNSTFTVDDTSTQPPSSDVPWIG